MAPSTIKHFLQSLNPSQRNTLKLVLHLETASSLLRRELGISHIVVMKEDDRRTGLARAGRTADLFKEHSRSSVTNLKADHERVIG
jgi:hypothetical protein